MCVCVCVQVDGRELISISPPEAVARIKEKTLVTLTVQRGNTGSASGGGGGGGEHVYDEIFYSDLSQQSQHSSQQDENTPLNMSTFPRPRGTGGRMAAVGTMDDSQRYYRQPHALSSPAPPPPTGGQPHPQHNHHHHHHHCSGAKPAHRGAGPVSHHAHPHSKPPQGVEKGSKDSGLSSGSSTHQEGGGAAEDRHAFLQGGKSHHRRLGSQGSQGSHPGGSQWVEQCSNDRCRIEGSYEVEVSF